MKPLLQYILLCIFNVHKQALSLLYYSQVFGYGSYSMLDLDPDPTMDQKNVHINLCTLSIDSFD